MRQLDNHYLPVSQIASGKPVGSESPGDLATMLEWQVGQAKDPTQKITITMTLRDANSLARMLRRAHLAGL
jgi:hypothetical protein